MRIWREHRRWFIGQALLWGVGVAVLRLVVVPPESCPPVGPAAIRQSISEGTAWLVRGQREDGRFLYGYFANSDEVSSDYNITRHAGVLDALYRTGHRGAADRGLRYVLDNLVRHDGWTAFALPGEDANVGANALLVIALMHRRQQTGSERYDDLARRLARFLVAQQRADGSVLQFWRPATGRRVPGVFGTYSTGEAFYALALMQRAFPDEGWERPAHRVARYLATRRDEAEGHTIRQPDHWAAYGLAALAPAGLTDTEADYARWLAGYFGYLVRWEAQHAEGGVVPYEESGAGLGTVGEATAALWRLAGEDSRLADLRGRLAVRSSCMAGILVERQVPAADPNQLARGAWFSDDYTQMDDQQHAIAALLGSSQVLR